MPDPTIADAKASLDATLARMELLRSEGWTNDTEIQLQCEELTSLKDIVDFLEALP